LRKTKPRQRPFGHDTAAEELWEKIQAEHPYPLTVMLEVTNRCNLSCKHCEVVEDGKEAMSLREIEGLLSDLSSAGVLSLPLTGGEPTLRADLEKIVEAAKRQRFMVEIKTNGTSLSYSRIDDLVAAGLDRVDVSLYHANPKAHDRFVGITGAWLSTITALRRFRDKGIMTRVGIIAMNWNTEAVPDLLDLCEKEEFEYVVDCQIAPRQDGSNDPCYLAASGDQVTRMMVDDRLLDPKALQSRLQRDPESPICNAGRGLAYIRQNGDLLLCPRIHQSIGNVREVSFSELWKDESKRAWFTDVRWKHNEECLKCEWAWACSRCPALSLYEHGQVTGPSSICCVAARAVAEACQRHCGSSVGQEEQ
jgi:radical SAM protein with 4Fe4S-binding SPASM domain